MAKGYTLREWATPLTMGAFALSAITGILLFFKVHLGLVKPVHEWLSWLLVIGAAFHLAANWQVFVQCLSRPLGKGIMAIFLLLVCASLIPLGAGQKGQQQHRKISHILAGASLSSVARVADHDPAEVIAMLRSKGVSVDSGEQTVGEISRKNGKPPVYVLDIIF